MIFISIWGVDNDTWENTMFALVIIRSDNLRRSRKCSRAYGTNIPILKGPSGEYLKISLEPSEEFASVPVVERYFLGAVVCCKQHSPAVIQPPFLHSISPQVRGCPIEDRAPLRTPGPEWQTSFVEYLSKIDCPLDLSTGTPQDAQG